MILAGCDLAGRTGHQAGRDLLAELYREVTGAPLPEIRVSPRGKPSFVNSPWSFSITHTSRHVFCALARNPIGIDAEETDRRIDLRLAEKILSPMEYAQFAEAPVPTQALLTFWVLKEAAAKCTGEGLRGYPNHTTFSLDDPRVQQLRGCLVAIIEEKPENEENNHAV